MEYFEDIALGPELPLPIKEWKRYVDDVFSIIPKGQWDTMLNYLNSIDPHIKFTVEQPDEEGAIPFLDTLPKPKGEEITVLSSQETYTHWQLLGFQLKLPHFSQKSHGKGPHG